MKIKIDNVEYEFKDELLWEDLYNVKFPTDPEDAKQRMEFLSSILIATSINPKLNESLLKKMPISKVLKFMKPIMEQFNEELSNFL